MKFKHFMPMGIYSGIVEYCDGMQESRNISIEYYKNGRWHREDGPTIEWGDGLKEWWLDGNEFDEKNWKIEVGGLK